MNFHKLCGSEAAEQSLFDFYVTSCGGMIEFPERPLRGCTEER